MRIFSEQGVEIESYDPSTGYTTEEQRFVQHHEATEAVEEVSHYVVVREYPNGGKDVEKVVDIPGVEAKEAWDEYETVLVFHENPPSEPKDEPFSEDEPTDFERLEAQVFYTAMMTNTLMEDAYV